MNAKKVEFIEIEKITGITRHLDAISIDVADVSDNEWSIKFQNKTYERHLQALLPSSPMAVVPVFPLFAATPLESDSQNRRIRFHLNKTTAIDIELDTEKLALLKALLGNVSAQPKIVQ